MKILIKCTLFSVIILSSLTFYSKTIDWGQTGHRVVGEIAEDHLSRKAKRKIKELLNGHSLAFVSTFGDEIKSDARYREFYTWHYVNKPFDKNYQDAEKNPDGDLYTGIQKCKSIILDETSSRQDKEFYLKLLVHLIGDLHQPMHVGRAEDKGGNDFKVEWFYGKTNLHSVWDSKMINHYQMTYKELASNVDELSGNQIDEIQSGSLVDWVNETGKLAEKVYASAAEGENLRYEYMYLNFGLVRSQLQKGGIRLAKVLNELFD